MTLSDVLARPLLIYGIGNVGRQDDGLGPLLVERLEAAGVPDGVTLESGYQLVPEDALLLSRYTTVLFVDASAAAGAAEPYALEAVSPSPHPSFSTHVMSMGSLLALCASLYGRAPRGVALAIPGYDFEINAAVSVRAREHLEQALQDLRAAFGPIP